MERGHQIMAAILVLIITLVLMKVFKKRVYRGHPSIDEGRIRFVIWLASVVWAILCQACLLGFIYGIVHSNVAIIIGSVVALAAFIGCAIFLGTRREPKKQAA